MTTASRDYRPFIVNQWNLFDWDEIVAVEYNNDRDMPHYTLCFRIDSDWYYTPTTITVGYIVWSHQHRDIYNYSYAASNLHFTSSGEKGDIHKGLLKDCTNVYRFNSWDEFSLFMDKLSILEIL